MDHISYTTDQGVAWITLNRPKVFNSFNRAMALEMQDALDQAAADRGVRAVYLTGEGKAFCAGQDLSEVVDPNGPTLTQILTEHYNPIIRRIRLLEKPVVCAVNGVAAGAGANIALCCDVVVAAASASFIQAFSKIGLIPDSGGTFFLPRLVGFQKASALMMLGDRVGAADAAALGMLYQVFPDEQFAEASRKIALTLAEMPTRGLWLTKQALNQSLYNDLDTQLEVEDKLQSEAGTTYDYKEGVAAFLEKRKAVFKGE